MSFLLDTNICTAAMKMESRVFNRAIQYSGRLFTSRVVLAELYAGAFGGLKTAENLKAIENMLTEVSVLELDDDSARQFGQLKAFLKGQGIRVPAMDLLIASTALVHGLTLVTHNTIDFVNIPGLALVDWLAP